MITVVNTEGQGSLISKKVSPVKPTIDSVAINNWPSLGLKAISDDGNYFFSVVENQPAGMYTMEVISLHRSWNRKVITTKRPDAFFSKDNRQLVVKLRDTLAFWELGSNREKTLVVKDFKCPSKRWLCYRLQNNDSTIFVRDLTSGKELGFQSVLSYSFDSKGAKILFYEGSDNSWKRLRLLDFETSNESIVWSSKQGNSQITPYSVKFNNNDQQLVFVLEEKMPNGNTLPETSKSIWYYKPGMSQAMQCVNLDTFSSKGRSIIPDAIRFSANSNWIIFELEAEPAGEMPRSKTSPAAVKLSVWSYKDTNIQPEQRRLLEAAETIKSIVAVNTQTGKMVEFVANNPNRRVSKFLGDHVIVDDEEYIPSDGKGTFSHSVISLKDGSQRPLKKEAENLGYFSNSPDGKWLVFYDSKQMAYFSFDAETGFLRNITKDIPANFISESDRGVGKGAVAEVAGWLKDGKELLLYDRYDIWQIDPSGKRKPTNLTNGLGKKLKLKLRLVDGSESRYDNAFFSRGESVLITAFSPDTKYNGFYRKKIGEVGDPEQLYSGPYVFFRTPSQKLHSFRDPGMQPIKALNANVWIVKRQNAVESPNYYLTEDFKIFRQLTDLQPQKDYNWLTTELVTWKQLDGTLSQGVLYKPENFDPQKSYPLLFNYYEKMSHRCYEFLEPSFATDNINIPWFVSRGYLVFTPDIHYSIASQSGKTAGECAYNSVVSAAQYLAKLPYVDRARMAIQGHSFGGHQTAYIATHTSLFAAAVESSGTTDLISSYLTLTPFAASFEHSIKQGTTETGQGRIGATLWQRPDLYIKASSVLSADKVKTPILIMHNEADNNVGWRQGIEFYMALRRLGKPSWMLQYDNSGHAVLNKDAVDYTNRMNQFFDHYLKQAPAPRWMSQGIPYKNRAVDNGYDLDPAGNCSPTCKVCKTWNQRWAKDAVATKQLIEKEQKNQWMGLLHTVKQK